MIKLSDMSPEDRLDEDVQQGGVLGVPWDEVVRQIRTRG